MIEYIIYALAMVGAYYLLRDVVIPVTDAGLYASGYVVLYLLNVEWSVAANSPWQLVSTLPGLLWEGFKIRLFQTNVIEAYGKYRWTPYFRYERL